MILGQLIFKGGNMSESPVKASDEKFCSDCGAAIKLKAEICPKCGIRQPGVGTVAPNGKTRIAAALFAFFLGWLGAHKFYLGQVGFGILYLLFCWTMIPAIISLVEAILFFTMTDEVFTQKYGQA